MAARARQMLAALAANSTQSAKVKLRALLSLQQSADRESQRVLSAARTMTSEQSEMQTKVSGQIARLRSVHQLAHAVSRGDDLAGADAAAAAAKQRQIEEQTSHIKKFLAPGASSLLQPSLLQLFTYGSQEAEDYSAHLRKRGEARDKEEEKLEHLLAEATAPAPQFRGAS